MRKYDLIIIGAGLSGLMAAIEARDNGIKDIILIDREDETGGAIGVCVHGNYEYRGIDNLTIPELISKLTEDALKAGVKIECSTTALKIKDDNEVEIINPRDGITTIKADAIIIATGSREKPYGYKNVLGYGVMAGINTAYATMNYVNRKGALPGKKCIILGSDNIGMLAAKTLIMEGAEVVAVVETSGKIRANEEFASSIIDDFNLKVLLNHRVVKVNGNSRVTGVEIAEVDNRYKVIENTTVNCECDALVLCIQLKPDSVLAKECGIEIGRGIDKIIIDEDYKTSKEGIFACGTVTSGYDDVESVLNQGREVISGVLKYLESK